MNSTVLILFVLPFLAGAMIRSMLLKWKRGYILSGIFALTSAVVWLWTNHLADHGVDGTVMLWALMAIELAIGSLIVGGLSRLIKIIKHQKETDRLKGASALPNGSAFFRMKEHASIAMPRRMHQIIRRGDYFVWFVVLHRNAFCCEHHT